MRCRRLAEPAGAFWPRPAQDGGETGQGPSPPSQVLRPDSPPGGGRVGVAWHSPRADFTDVGTDGPNGDQDSERFHSPGAKGQATPGLSWGHAGPQPGGKTDSVPPKCVPAVPTRANSPPCLPEDAEGSAPP